MPSAIARSFSTFARRVASALPIRARESPEYWRTRRFLADAQWWPAERISRWQDEAVRRTVAFAYENTAGYRQLFDEAGVHPRDIRGASDLAHLPFTTKALFQDNLEAFSTRSRRRKYVTTGGSTGIPFGFYLRKKELVSERAFVHEGWSFAGWELGETSAVLRGSYVGTPDQPFRYDSYRRELHLSTYYLTEASLGTYLAALEQHSVGILQAYPSALHLFCDLLEGIPAHQRPVLDLILLGSENVYDWQLEKVQRVCPEARIHAWYGHAEQAILAPWCEQSRTYHVWPFYGAVELLDPAGRPVPFGSDGEVVATSLRVQGTPFIRYRTMDLATRGPDECSHCGRAFPVLSRVNGRSHEVIVTASGRHISMTMINMHDGIFDPLRQFQFVQHSPGVVAFRYVPKRSLTEAEIERIHAGLAEKLGSDMHLLLTEAAEIPRTRSGKARFLDQQLTIRYNDVD